MARTSIKTGLNPRAGLMAAPPADSLPGSGHVTPNLETGDQPGTGNTTSYVLFVPKLELLLSITRFEH